MTIIEAIERANNMKLGNAVTDESKMMWLNELDHMIYTEVLKKYRHNPDLPEWQDYTDDTDELIVEAPYNELYVFWIMAKIELSQQQYDEYNNDVSLFESMFERWKANYINTHIHARKPRIKVAMFR